jgi:hypothetical protein
MIMTGERQETVRRSRIYFLDNLRTFMIFLVVLYHVGLVYESSGIVAFFWIVDDPSTSTFPGILNMFIEIFIMTTMFFVSGFFAPLSLKNKTVWEFIKSKFRRLMIPWVIAVLTLIPLYKFIFLYSRGLPQHDWTTYFHFSNGIFSQNWLWFLPVLFLFNILYLFLSKTKLNISNIPLKSAVLAVFLAGLAYSLCMDIFNAGGWTKTILIDFQNERLLVYFLYFILGSLCFDRKTFETKWKSKKLYYVVNGVSWIPITLYLVFIINLFIRPGVHIISSFADMLMLRLNFHLSLLCMLYVLVNTFRYYFDKQGRIGKELSRNSYYVYIIHTVVIGGIALTMLGTAIPALLKYLILTVSTYVACNVVISLFRKVVRIQGEK